MKCPYCKSTKVIKKGLRLKKHEKVQLYYCHHCRKKFTPLFSRGKTYPLKIILDSLSFYNRCHPLEESAKIVSEKYGLKVSPQNISNWLKDFGQYLPFLRLRQFIAKKYQRGEILVESKLFHGQIYDFKYHRAKTDLILDEHFRHYKFRPLQEFLELVCAECPHQVFKETDLRASEYKNIFNLDKVRITPKSNNTAIINSKLVLQSVANNKLRHQVLQEFMLINDSVTVAVEVPVLLDEDDLRHYRDELGFEIPDALRASNSKSEILSSNLSGASNLEFGASVITGHIDLLQIRNGLVHILDYKPSARKARPVDQLTIYALALSRLTGLRLFNFKCAWFDEEDYFEFFPLHVVYKKKRRKKKI